MIILNDTEFAEALIGGFGWNFAIIDICCTRSVVGSRWTEGYFAAL